MTSGNQLLPDNTTKKSRMENQNQKTILSKEDTSSSKEKSYVCSNCKDHYEFHEDTMKISFERNISLGFFSVISQNLFYIENLISISHL